MNIELLSSCRDAIRREPGARSQGGVAFEDARQEWQLKMTLTRRALLSSAAVIALARPAMGQVRQLINDPGPFWGNPNARIIAIDTSGGIALSRNSGQTPAFVQASASAIVCTGTIVDSDGNTLARHSVSPYEDLEYHWNFGDPSGTETFVRPTDGVAVNANIAQHGPEAAYCYRSPGTYTITLTIRRWTARDALRRPNAFVETTVTATFTVTAFDSSRGGEWFFDSAAPAGGYGNEKSPFNSLTTLQSKVARSGTSIHIKRGSVFSGTSGIDIRGTEVNGLRIDAYGTGENPKVQVSSGGQAPLTLFNSNTTNGRPYPKTDIVISNIDFVNLSTRNAVVIINLLATAGIGDTLRDNYFDRCNLVSSEGNGTPFDTVTAHASYRMGFWGGSIVGSQTPDTGCRSGIFTSMTSWYFMVGIAVSGAATGTASTSGHHIYASVATHTLYRWVTLGPGPHRNLGIKLRARVLGAYSPYHVVSECNLTGVQFGLAPGNENNSSTLAKGRLNNLVVQNCAIHDLPGGCAYFASTASATFRDNLLWRTGGRLMTPSGDLNDLFVGKTYRNKVYSEFANAAMIDYTGADGLWRMPQQITDNVFYYTSSDAKVIKLNVSDMQTNGSLIDRNHYWAPNDTDRKYLFNKSTGVVFGPTGTAGTWQNAGFDRNGMASNPNWPNPANGRFRPSR